ncbi:MAG: glycosyltransferase [Cyclobacteriaceae bacterium]|nr:glycosyltransferase [Cyclobacteriaceae bacterium]
MLFLFLLAALGIQIIYFLGFLWAFARPGDERKGDPPPATVVVCAHNEEANLKALVPLLLGQDHPDLEVVIVLDRTRDGSRSFLQAISATHQNLRYVDVTNVPAGVNGKKYGLLQGIREAKRDILLLTDADCRPERGWASAMASAFDSETTIVLGYSPYLKTSGLLNTFIRFETLLTGIQYLGLARLGFPYMGVGRNLAYRKSFFTSTNGFDGIMSVTGGDDDLWVNRNARAGHTRVRMGADSLVWSVPKPNWKEFLQQKTRHLSAGRHYRAASRALIGTFHISYILSWVLFLGALVLGFPITPVILMVFAGRLLLFIGLIATASQQLGDKFPLWSVIVLDFLYVFYYISTALRALFTRTVQWTN